MTRSRTKTLIGAFAAAVLHMSTLQPASAQGQPAGARALIEEAANALGGVDRLRAVKNITLYGNGLWAYQFGMANVTASPNAAMREIAPMICAGSTIWSMTAFSRKNGAT